MAHKTLVHKQFNSPIGLYSNRNVQETLDRELRTLSNGAVGTLIICLLLVLLRGFHAGDENRGPGSGLSAQGRIDINRLTRGRPLKIPKLKLLTPWISYTNLPLVSPKPTHQFTWKLLLVYGDGV
uniref:Zasp-like motif domain-containing protein n=1 Tax=Lutzomyia longipalpis TaxID=7200 RepID=A0A1B0CIH3_LUTLO